MPLITKITLFLLACLVPSIVLDSNLAPYSPQIIAFVSLILIALSLKYHRVSTFMVVFIVQMIVFSTGGLLSPLLFLEYFLLFSLSFQESPKTILAFSLILCFTISQSLISRQSFLNLFSFVFISPLAYLVTKKLETDEKRRLDTLLLLTLEQKQKSQSVQDLISELKSDD